MYRLEINISKHSNNNKVVAVVHNKYNQIKISKLSLILIEMHNNHFKN